MSHTILWIQGLSPAPVQTSFIAAGFTPDIRQNQVCLQAIGQFVQHLLAQIRCLHTLAITPVCLCQRKQKVNSLRILLNKCVQLRNRPRRQVPSYIQAGQCAAA